MPLSKRFDTSNTSAGILRKIAALVAAETTSGYDLSVINESHVSSTEWYVEIVLESKEEPDHIAVIRATTSKVTGLTSFRFTFAGTQLVETDPVFVNDQGLFIFSAIEGSKACFNMVIPGIVYFAACQGSFAFTGAASGVAVAFAGTPAASSVLWAGPGPSDKGIFYDGSAILLSQKACLAGKTNSSLLFSDGQKTNTFTPLPGQLPFSSLGDSAAYPIDLAFVRKDNYFEQTPPVASDSNLIKLPLDFVAHGEVVPNDYVTSVIGLPGNYAQCLFDAPDFATAILVRVS
jgi:hypothetical protein